MCDFHYTPHNTQTFPLQILVLANLIKNLRWNDVDLHVKERNGRHAYLYLNLETTKFLTRLLSVRLQIIMHIKWNLVSS